MTYEVQESKEALGDYLAFAVDHESEGEIYLTLFSGPNARERAVEYAAWKNAQP
jgi:hypothetical protein